MSLPFLFFIPATLLFFVFLLNRPRNKAKNGLPLPPGPPRDPIIGNLRVVPTVRQPETFHEWAKTYGVYQISSQHSRLLTEYALGDVMYLEVLGRKMLVLDSLEAATDLLDKRSTKYSSRPGIVVFDRFVQK